MDKKGVNRCEPIDDKSAYGNDQLIDFTSGYFQRGLNQMPRQGISTMEELSELFKRYICCKTYVN